MVARQVRRSVVMSNLRVGLLPWIQTGLRSERGKTSFTAPSAPLLSNIALNSPEGEPDCHEQQDLQVIHGCRHKSRSKHQDARDHRWNCCVQTALLAVLIGPICNIEHAKHRHDEWRARKDADHKVAELTV